MLEALFVCHLWEAQFVGFCRADVISLRARCPSEERKRGWWRQWWVGTITASSLELLTLWSCSVLECYVEGTAESQKIVSWAGEVAQWLKMLATRPEGHHGRGREWTSKSCPLTSTNIVAHGYPPFPK